MLLAALAAGLLVPAAGGVLAAPAALAQEEDPDSDGDGIDDLDDKCPDEAGNGSFDGCPAVADVDDLTKEARRVAKRLDKRWKRATVRSEAFATRSLTVTVHMPKSAARGRGMRVGIQVYPRYKRGDGPLGTLMFGKGVPCEPGRRCKVKLRLRPKVFPNARGHKLRLDVNVSPKDTIGWTGGTAALRLKPRHA